MRVDLKNIAGRITVGMVILLAFMFSQGCETNSPIGSNPDSGLKLERSLKQVEDVYPFTQEDPATGIVYSGVLYMYSSTYGKAKIDGAYNVSSVAFDVSDLLVEGYTVADDRSKVVTTTAVVTPEQAETEVWNEGDTIDVELIILVFEQALADEDSSWDSYAVIHYTSLDGEVLVTQCEKLFYGDYPYDYWGDDGYSILVGVDESEREVWVQTFEPSVRRMTLGPSLVNPFGPPGGADPRGWDWDSFLKCAATGTAGGCATAAIACTIANIAYPLCLGVGCGATAVGASVACAISQLW